MAITFGDESGSGPNANVSSITFAHVVASGSNKFVTAKAQMRDTASQTDPVITGVTFNGDALTIGHPEEIQDNNLQWIRSEIWGMFAPDEVTGNVVVTFTGVVNFSGAQALTMFGVKQSTTPNVTGGDGEPNDLVSDPSVSVTTTVDGCVVIDSVYNQTVDTMTLGAGQNLIDSQYDPRNGGGDRAGSSYKETTTAGVKTMSWTCPSNVDKWVQAVVAYEPATSAITVKKLAMLGVG